MMRKVIKIACEGNTSIPVEKLMDFQEGLKTLDDSRYAKLRDSIAMNGFIAPFFVWVRGGRSYILDGHQRAKAIARMKEEGWEIPKAFPACVVEAASKAEAKRKLLAITSRYGDFDMEALVAFVDGLNVPDLEATVSIEGFDFGELVPVEVLEGEAAERDVSLIATKSKCPRCGYEW